jgi:hypothetical protein
MGEADRPSKVTRLPGMTRPKAVGSSAYAIDGTAVISNSGCKRGGLRPIPWKEGWRSAMER